MEADTLVESGKATSIQISVEIYAKLRSLQDQLQKILRKKKVSFDQVIKVMLATHPLDVVLINMMLQDEETKSAEFDVPKTLPEASNHEEEDE